MYRKSCLSHFDFDSVKLVNHRTHLDLTINYENEPKTLTFNSHWLRFNDQTSKSLHSSTGQRIIDVDTVPNVLFIENVEKVESNKIRIEWNSASAQEDSFIPIEYLIKNYPDYNEQSYKLVNFKSTDQLKFFDFQTLVDQDGKRVKENVYDWLKYLAEYGVCIVKNVPVELNMVRKVAELIAPLQKTFYSEIFDVKIDDNPTNLAFSNEKLGFHNDITYYESSPGIQFLHCLKFASNIVGGESTFVDAFKVAEDFRRDYPQHFEVLSKTPVFFKKILENCERPICMLIRRPIFVVNHRNKLIGVNWSPQNEGPLLNLSNDEVTAFYEAYLTYSKYLNQHPLIIRHRLEPGEVAVFNNRRVFHAREAFKTLNNARHLQGCYVNIDEFKSEVLVLDKLYGNKEKQEVDLADLPYGNYDHY